MFLYPGNIFNYYYIIKSITRVRGLTDVSVMRLSPVGAASPPRVIEPLLVPVALRRGPRSGLRHRATAAGLVARRRPILRRPSVVLSRALAVRLAAAFRLGHEDRQSSRYDRAAPRFR